MRALLAILIVAAVAYVGYTYLYVPMSDEEAKVDALSKRFDKASRQLLDAERRMGSTGLDTTDDASSAIRKVKKIKDELTNLKAILKEETSKNKAKELEGKIKKFYQKVGIY
jgi:hypothetical protein